MPGGAALSLIYASFFNCRQTPTHTATHINPHSAQGAQRGYKVFGETGVTRGERSVAL